MFEDVKKDQKLKNEKLNQVSGGSNSSKTKEKNSDVTRSSVDYFNSKTHRS